MKEVTLKELALPLIKAIDSFNYLLKSHHRRVAVIAYNIAKELNLSEKDLSELVIAPLCMILEHYLFKKEIC